MKRSLVGTLEYLLLIGTLAVLYAVGSGMLHA
jgi:hypothetical protein